MSIKPSDPAFHRRQLQEWLSEYELDRRLREPLSLNSVAMTDSDSCVPKNPVPASGQIRLLAPKSVSMPAAERPVYVLLMPARSAEALTLIPFSRFPVPATPMEWRTSFRREPLRVLCLWNQQNCALSNFPASWFIQAISRKQQADVAHALETSCHRKARASRRFGPPLLHPLDPRHVYLQEERMLLSEICGKQNESAPISIAYPDCGCDAQQLLAAESRTAYPKKDSGGTQILSEAGNGTPEG